MPAGMLPAGRHGVDDGDQCGGQEANQKAEADEEEGASKVLLSLLGHAVHALAADQRGVAASSTTGRRH